MKKLQNILKMECQTKTVAIILFLNVHFLENYAIYFAYKKTNVQCNFFNEVEKIFFHPFKQK